MVQDPAHWAGDLLPALAGAGSWLVIAALSVCWGWWWAH
jgi:hypothetical protein